MDFSVRGQEPGLNPDDLCSRLLVSCSEGVMNYFIFVSFI